MQRRTLLAGLAGILASGLAPASIGSQILMPITPLRPKRWLVPEAPGWDWKSEYFSRVGRGYPPYFYNPSLLA